ncbi:MDR family MFS transporter [Salinibacterium hongtaonis]|uniref:MDR family MFS transporter n=1 Tax=Homoserinimonas hongtaonis TaxID=2079791 RepID=UPI001F542B11|nr:MDR family MFS transporter [Salinibacterium hongtaonis]
MQIDSDTAPSQSGERKGSLLLVFIGLMVAMLLSSLSQTVLSSAMPTMVGELDGVDHMLWVMTAFMLSSTIVMPIYGKLGDLMGRKSLMIGAILLFMAGSLIGALSVDMNMLIGGRVVQGLGGGGLMILSQAIIADVVPARERGKYMGVMGAVFAVSSVAGPLLGGWFTEGIGWRWTFWINMPLGLLALAAAVFLLHLPKRATTSKPKIDGWGMAFLALTTTCIVLVASWGGKDYAWDSLTIIGLIAGAVVAAVVFVLIERTTAEPIMPLHLFREANFNLTTIAGLLTSIGMFGVIGYLPTYLQMAYGSTAMEAGMLMIPMMLALLLTSIVSGALVSKHGRYKVIPIVGTFIAAGGLALLGTITPETPVWLFCIFVAVMGVGLGASMQILVLIVQNTFPNREVGTATAANNYFRQIGASLGAAVIGSLFTSRLVTELADRLPSGGGAGSTNSLTPDMVHRLPEAVQDVIALAYSSALTPLFFALVPAMVLAGVLLFFVKEKPLATTIERDVMPEAIAEGQLLITSDEPSAHDADAEADAAPHR